MEMSRLEVKTRARAALAMASATSPKRRKIVVNESSTEHFKFSASSFVQLRSVSDSSSSPAAEERRCSISLTSDESPSSCCSSNESFSHDENRIIKFSDLEVESAQVETSTCKRIRREMSLRTNSQEVEKKPTTQRKSRCVLSPPKKMPTESELEEFFSSAEKDIQKRFSDKYNYDIVKDVPLKGRYEWVQLKP